MAPARTGRMPGIDGLRGLAALWVLAFHIYTGSGIRWSGLPVVDRILGDPFHGVSLFLLLSGFCLYLPFAGGRGRSFAGRAFFQRRAWRLLPAYYAVLAVVLVSKLTLAGLAGERPVSPGDLLWTTAIHVTLLHNMTADTFYELNGAFWSLGLEWQLYWFFPFLIWFIVRFGMLKTLAVALVCHFTYFLVITFAEVISVIPRGTLWDAQVFPNQALGRWAEFIFGMVAAELYVTRKFPRSRAVVLSALVVAVGLNFTLDVGWPLREFLSGIMFFLIVSLVAQGGLADKLASWRPLVAVGTFSYSLYLVHGPMLIAAEHFAPRLPLDRSTATLCASLALVPVILLASWGLYQVAERPFLSSNSGFRAWSKQRLREMGWLRGDAWLVADPRHRTHRIASD